MEARGLNRGTPSPPLRCEQFIGSLRLAGPHLKVHIWEAAPAAEGPVDLQDGLRVFVRDEEFRGKRVPLLDHVAHRVTRGRLDLQLGRRDGRRKVLTAHSHNDD